MNNDQNKVIENQLEELRLKAVKKQNTIYIVSAIITAIIIVILINIRVYPAIIPIIMVMLTISLLLANFIKEKKLFLKSYKEKIVIATLNSIFEDVHFDLEKGISKEVIRDTNMMSMGNTYYSNDYFYGKYKDIGFQCSDVTIKEVTTDGEGHTTTTTYFDGQWYIFEFNKNFKGSFQVCEKSFHYSKRQGGLFSKEEKDEKIEMEDQEFNKQFKVFGTDPHSVFYVLTPNTIERIKKVNNEIPGSLLFCFKNSQLHIGVYNGKDLFEPKLRKKVNLQQDTQTTKSEINSILQFVDILRLDNDLFK